MPPVERRMKDVLRCPEKQNNYDETDIHSIFQYALGIEGKTLLTILQEAGLATVYKGNIIKNLIMDCQSYTKYRPNETTGGIFVSWRRKEELPTGA